MEATEDSKFLPNSIILLEYVFEVKEEFDEELEIKGSYFAVSISLLY